MCDSSTTSVNVLGTNATDCSGYVLVGTVCRAIDCPVNSSALGYTECYPSEQMVGTTYCVADGVNISQISTVFAEFRLKLALSDLVNTESLRGSMKEALEDALGITDSDYILQFLVEVTELFTSSSGGLLLENQSRLLGVNRGALYGGGRGGDKRSLRSSRHLTAEAPVRLTATAFYEIQVPNGVTEEELVAAADDLVNSSTSVAAAFTAALGSVGGATAELTSMESVERAIVRSQEIGVDSLGRPLFFDSDGNGVVDAVDYVTSTSTSTSETSTTSTSTSTTTSPEPIEAEEEEDDLLMLIAIIAASVVGVLLLCGCLCACYIFYKRRFALETV